MKRTTIWVMAMMMALTSAVNAQENASSEGQFVRCIAFYNLENLFDTIHDEGKNDYEYLPDVGVAEVENIGCLYDLCAEANSQYGRRLKPILIEGPDRRGVDVGFLYDTVMFKPSKVNGYELKAH